jgi:protein phosphatase
MQLTIPELALVVLVGPSGAGKSTFAARHFKRTEVLSSDFCRGLASDDENDQSATADAFDILHFIAAKRLAAGRLTVVDATNVQPEARKPLVALARQHHCLPVAIVLDVPGKVCHERNANRPDRLFGPHVVRQQSAQLHRSLRGLEREGFRRVHVLSGQEKIDAAVITRQRLWNNRKDDHGPFDIIGDVHGCFDELVELLAKLGYEQPDPGAEPLDWRHPAGRRPVFLGDLTDRGPDSPAVCKLVMRLVETGGALCVPGNHDVRLMRKLGGRDVKLSHGLAETLAQLEPEPPEFKERLRRFLDSLVSHYVLDDGNLVVAHAGLKESMQGRASGAVRDFALYGETTGETDEYGLPVRYPWAADYRGRAAVVYGHTPQVRAEWLNRTINIDTGCVFGGALTALRYPEMELVSVPARKIHFPSPKPFPFEHEGEAAPVPSIQQAQDDALDLEDVSGKRIIATRLRGNITVREENATAALEIMSRFAIDPKWLIYLPPTMSPCETSQADGLLEYPAEAFAYYRDRGIPAVICQEKHMGSRAVVIVCRDGDAARRRFGVSDDDADLGGVIYTRTGRRFFDSDQREYENALLSRLRAAATTAGLWDELETDWVCLDCELMPWSAKARGLLSTQYAPVGSAATASLSETVTALEQAVLNQPDAAPLLETAKARLAAASAYVTAYRAYCWPVASAEDLRLAPFHLLASEGRAHVNRDHPWHLQTLARLAETDPLFIATASRRVDLTDADSAADGTAWWLELTARGGEGMVVKPLDFIAKGGTRNELLQPAVKCRGPEYLRIIYGPEYDRPENLSRLRSRGLGAKRSLALREFALGVEALERFAARRQPLRWVHECVFGVLALESEPMDPRL